MALRITFQLHFLCYFFFFFRKIENILSLKTMVFPGMSFSTVTIRNRLYLYNILRSMIYIVVLEKCIDQMYDKLICFISVVCSFFYFVKVVFNLKKIIYIPLLTYKKGRWLFEIKKKIFAIEVNNLYQKKIRLMLF